MKKLVIIFSALTLLMTFSVGYAETKSDSPLVKFCSIFSAQRGLEKNQNSVTKEISEAKANSPKVEPGTIFTVDKDLEKVQKYGY